MNFYEVPDATYQVSRQSASGSGEAFFKVVEMFSNGL